MKLNGKGSKMKLSSVSSETDKDFTHNTIHIYESLFEPIKNRVTKLLEVGINTGNSHRMWRDYFQDATIYGVDIQNLCNGMEGEERIVAIFGDAYSHTMLDSFGDTKFDIIIDDGPHTLASMIFFVQNYNRLLNDNGILIVEDIPDISWIHELTVSVPEDQRNFCYGIDRRSVANNSWFHDEILFVLDKRFV